MVRTGLFARRMAYNERGHEQAFELTGNGTLGREPNPGRGGTHRSQPYAAGCAGGSVTGPRGTGA
ncbi:hypothetical protein [Lysobacter gummosus]|uniref:hypothetical protein n=1 Tax=Lysobacter gummosus TaxID=262324 RepID=UPI0036401909